jgi:hypothetical protein
MNIVFKWIKRWYGLANARFALAALMLWPALASAELLELKQSLVEYNLRTQRGMPLSMEGTTMLGSDLRAPSNTRTKGQFGGFMAFGSSAAPKLDQRSALNTDQSYFDNADEINLPRGENGMVFTRISIGAPMFGREVNFLIGQIAYKPTVIGEGRDKTQVADPRMFWANEPFIPSIQIVSASELKGIATVVTSAPHGLVRGDLVQITGVDGIPDEQLPVLSIGSTTEYDVQSNVDATSLFLDSLDAAAGNQPVTAKDLVVGQGVSRKAHEANGYYYSPHARSIIMIQPGPVTIPWRYNRPEGSQPAGTENVDWAKVNTSYYKLYNKRYTVSASTVKDPVSIFWNKEPDYSGPIVALPEGLGELHIAYTKLFPEKVRPSEAVGGRVSGTGQSADIELRTLWVNKLSPKMRTLNALNATGRVIIELLGDYRQDGSRKHLGFEIVDVKKSSIPTNKTLDLGVRVMAQENKEPVFDESLKVDLRDKGKELGKEFTINALLPSTKQMAIYGIRETVNENDLVAFWLKEGIGGIFWPRYHNRYHLQWPVDSSSYSHYIRPEVEENRAWETAVYLAPENMPKIQYQDLDNHGSERARMEAKEMKFYTWLDNGYPTHRTLLSYETVAGGIAFEHVFSWLDTSINDGQWPKTQEVTHLSDWPKVRIKGMQGVPIKANGNILLKQFEGAGDKIVDLVSMSKFPKLPDDQIALPYFEYPNTGDIADKGGNTVANYGSQIQGYFHPDNDGWYRFAIASDDAGELWLSTDSNPENKEAIAINPSWSASRDYSRQSDPIELKKERAYYIESLHKQGTGGGHISVAFSYGTAETNVPRLTNSDIPINGSYLSPYSSLVDLTGGLKVHALGYPFEKGEIIGFPGGSTFTFTEAAQKGATVIYGDLIGQVMDGDVGLPDELNIAPKVRVAMSAESTNAMKFTRARNQYMSLPSRKLMTDLTVEFWFRTADPDAGLFSHRQGNDRGRIELYLQDGVMRGSAIGINDLNEVELAAGSNLSDSEWHHVALTINSGDITHPGDIARGLPSENNHLANRGHAAIDNDLDTFIQQTGPNSGVEVQTHGGVVVGLALTSSPNEPTRDPTSFKLLGSNNGGRSYDIIDTGVVPEFSARKERVSIEITNSTSYRNYQVLFPEVGNADGMMQLAELELIGNLPAVSFIEDISLPGNTVVPSSDNSPSSGSENAEFAIDNNPATKYLNFDGAWDESVDSGLTITTGGGVVSGLGLTSANDLSERDPTSFVLSGSNDGGATFTEIASGVLSTFVDRLTRQTVRFGNSIAYTTYRLILPTRRGAGVDAMQIAEVELLSEKPRTSDDDAINFTGMALYIDGQIMARTSELDWLAVAGYAQTQLGWSDYADNAFLEGELDEFRLWDIVRTSEQIKSYHNSALPATYAGLISYYSFDVVINGRDLPDLAGVGQNGRLYGFPSGGDLVQGKSLASLLSVDPLKIEVNPGDQFTFDSPSGIVTFDVQDYAPAGSIEISGELSGSVTANSKATLNDSKLLKGPRYVRQSYDVGTRITAPLKELGTNVGEGYWAGYIHEGTAYNSKAYKNPLVEGFESANKGVIIPVNADPTGAGAVNRIEITKGGASYTTATELPTTVLPSGGSGATVDITTSEGVIKTVTINNAGTGYSDKDVLTVIQEGSSGGTFKVKVYAGNNNLTVFWHREHRAKQDPNLGYEPVYWPSVVGYYTLNWPSSGPDIVLASNDGSGALNSLQQKGQIYRQSDKSKPGYNPNEEHALMLGGQVWALRADLNQINPGLDYSSQPFVLLEYLDDDDRLSMTPIMVMAEKPSAGIVFDYVTEAGKVLQAPMPLPLLDKPVHKEVELRGELMDHEVAFEEEPVTDNPVAWDQNAAQNLNHYEKFTFVDRKNTSWVYRGRHDGKPALEVGSYDGERFNALMDARAVAGQVFEYHLHTSQWAPHLQMVAKDPETMPSWLEIEGLVLKGTPGVSDADSQITIRLVINSDDRKVEKILNIDVAISGSVLSQPPLNKGVEGDRYLGRPPYLAVDSTANNSFRMKFWYKNLADFDYPSGEQYELGDNIQYIHTPSDVAGNTVLDHGTRDYVVYRPIWPNAAPKLPRAGTLTVPTAGLPAVRGQTSVSLLYQQSVAKNAISTMDRTFNVYQRNTDGSLKFDNNRLLTEYRVEQWSTSESESVKLHDPTREKTYEFESEEKFPPADILTSSYQGLMFFPKLPPHLVKRLFFDPNRGVNGALVLGGSFIDEIVGEDYLMLNLISDNDKTILDGFSSDSTWKNAIVGLTTDMVSFVQKRRTSEDVNFVEGTEGDLIPGLFEEDKVAVIEYDTLTEAELENTPVDSFALSAAGPGSGYISLIVGNGNGKITPESDPVSIYIIKIIPDLYQGELKVIYSENPLDELVSLRHSGDFGGEFRDYEFEWRKGYPVDGKAPPLMKGGTLNPEWIKIDSASAVGMNSLIHGDGGTGVDTLKDVYYLLKYRPSVLTKLASGMLNLILDSDSDGDGIGEDPGSGYIDEKGLATTVQSGGGVGATVDITTEDGAITKVTLNSPGSGYNEGDELTIVQRNATGGVIKISSWSDWTKPKFVEGWIKRVLAGINPFNQRVKDLYTNAANTDASMLTQAGGRWEGDVALNMQNISNSGLIEIYETVLNRGKMLSIDNDINDTGANQALLLAAGYLNDLYMMIGNDAFADASNPTIGFGTGDGQYGDIATSLFSFKGQVSTLMQEELGLLRGRDDFQAPNVELRPVYNRMFWNYTRGIDAGEVVYALNYNIKERDGAKLDGNVDAADAEHMYPQGHGDAYGHYLSAIKGYYRLLVDGDFQWISQTEAVSVRGVGNTEVAVDYMDERKFAASAVALARTGSQVYELTWSEDYIPDSANGWKHMAKTRSNENRSYTGLDNEIKNPTRHWGQDHWGARVMAGSYLNWVVGNAMVPAFDTDPTHEGIKKIDRTTVFELMEVADLARELQITADNAASGLNPLGLPEDTVPFDISPDFIGGDPGEKRGHMDQIYGRAVAALGNAVAAFDSSKNITQLMRTEEDSRADMQTAIEGEELGYKHRLIEIFGTPYADDIGPGKIYKQGYDGPDLLHYQYVGTDNLTSSKGVPEQWNREYTIDRRAFAPEELGEAFQLIDGTTENTDSDQAYQFAVESLFTGNDFAKNSNMTTTYTVGDHGFFIMPSHYNGKRMSPGEIQFTIGDIAQTHADFVEALADAEALKMEMDQKLALFTATVDTKRILIGLGGDIAQSELETAGAGFAADMSNLTAGYGHELADDISKAIGEATPDLTVVGLSVGGNFLKVASAIWNGTKSGVKIGLAAADVVVAIAAGTRELVHIKNEADWETEMQVAEDKLDLKEMLYEIEQTSWALGNAEFAVETAGRNYSTAVDRYRAIVASGNRILKEREIFRKRAAARVHGYRTRDAGFRIFRNEKLERYKSMFDLAARYTYFAAKAYDYETGQLGSVKGKKFLSRIVASRALGVVQGEDPQFAGSNMGDPGLSSVLAEMKADWDVLSNRLGINNPDTYGTTASFRTENHRILPGAAGKTRWQDTLNNARMRNILADADVKKLCMQLANDNSLPVPGIVLEFSTMIADGYNLFGKKLSSGDHSFSPTSYATKILAAGICFEGYEGMDYTTTEGGVTDVPVMLNPKGLSATPYVYLIPCGLDAMRSPPLGDKSLVRTWNVQDATIPMPFNIGGSEFETKRLWQTSDSLSEMLFNVRKHQAFRAVDNVRFFRDGPLTVPNNFTNNRLIGRSVWNTKWKLVIPGKTLLDDPEEGLDLFINTVDDIKIHFETYSYSGN